MGTTLDQALWAVSIQGPDDLVPVADYLSAVRVANRFNEWWAQLKTAKPLHPYEPRMWAIPVEWTGDAERHAEWVASPSSDYAPFLAALPNQPVREALTDTEFDSAVQSAFDAYAEVAGEFPDGAGIEAVVVALSLPASPAGEGRLAVKPLEWERRTDRFWKADPFNHVMHYGIEAHEREFSWYLGVEFMGRVDTFTEAKAAAQADFERRILSALTPTAQESVVRQWRYRNSLTKHWTRWFEGEPPKPNDIDEVETRVLYAAPVAAQEAGWRPTHRHKKRGTDYVLIGIGKMQSENWYEHGETILGHLASETVDMAEVAVYRAVNDGSLWVRPREEFQDGRFEPLPPAPSEGE